MLILLLISCSPEPISETTTLETTSEMMTITLSPISPLTTDDLVATVTGAPDTTALEFAWYGNNTIDTEQVSSLLQAEQTMAGDSWRVVVTPIEDNIAGQAISAKITIENSPPEVVSLTLTEDPTAADTITATVVSDDADGDAVTLTHHWFVNGDDTTITEKSLPSGYAIKGDEVLCSVAPDDGETAGAAVESTVTVANSPPSVASATFGVASISHGETLTISTSGWYDLDDDVEGYSYAWFVDGVEISWDQVELTLSDVVEDQVLYATATPFDGEASGKPVVTELLVVSE